MVNQKRSHVLHLIKHMLWIVWMFCLHQGLTSTEKTLRASPSSANAKTKLKLYANIKQLVVGSIASACVLFVLILLGHLKFHSVLHHFIWIAFVVGEVSCLFVW
jgi:hypothetical protein